MTNTFNNLEYLVTCHAGFMNPKRLATRLKSRQILLNGEPTRSDVVLQPGDIVRFDNADFRAIEGGQGRLQLVGAKPTGPLEHEGPLRVHCGLHKCLTMYQRRVYGRALRVWQRRKLNFSQKGRRPFHHFYHRHDFFAANAHKHFVSSISGHHLDFSKCNDYRAVRFIRDPRDLLVSGYHYHRKSAEHWCDLRESTDVDWTLVNGCVPERLPSSKTFGSWLQEASIEEGLLAEIEFRRYHYESMMKWSLQDPNIRTFRYEDLLGNEAQTFTEVFAFLQLPDVAQKAASHFGEKFSAGKKKANNAHIRNPNHGQWRKHFTPAVTKAFEEQYSGLLERLGYD